MNQVLESMFDVGYPMFLSFCVGVFFGTRVIRDVLLKRLAEKEELPHGDHSSIPTSR